MKTILKIIVAAIVATGMACALAAHDVSGNAVVVSGIAAAVLAALVMGVFDMPAKLRDMKRMKNAARYGEAA